MDSPIVEVVGYCGGRLPAGNSDYSNSYYSNLYHQLVLRGEYDAALRLCVERQLVARDERETLIWTKDAALVERLQRNLMSSLALQASVWRLAERADGQLRGRWHNGHGRTLALMGRHYEAFEQYDLALSYYVAPYLRGGVLNNKARLLTENGAPELAKPLLIEAQRMAHKSGSVLLEAEALESLALAEEASGALYDALRTATRSVEVLDGTPYTAARQENAETLGRLARRIGEAR